jgi:hypothetical protein
MAIGKQAQRGPGRHRGLRESRMHRYLREPVSKPPHMNTSFLEFSEKLNPNMWVLSMPCATACKWYKATPGRGLLLARPDYTVPVPALATPSAIVARVAPGGNALNRCTGNGTGGFRTLCGSINDERGRERLGGYDKSRLTWAHFS